MKFSCRISAIFLLLSGSPGVLASQAPAACFADLREQMFADDRVMDVRVVLGFMDIVGQLGDDRNQDLNRSIGGDRYRQTLKSQGYRLVDVKRLNGGAKIPEGQGEVYEKMDSEGRTLRVSLIFSSTPDDQYSFFASKRAEAFFDKALQDADVVIYNGHSRDGGGPDMHRPQTVKDGEGLHVDYAHYQKKKPGLERIENSLKKTENKPELIASLSCSSYDHFYQFFEKNLRCKDQSTGLVLSTRTANLDEAYRAGAVIINSLTENKDLAQEIEKVSACASGFYGSSKPFRYDQVKPEAKPASRSHKSRR